MPVYYRQQNPIGAMAGAVAQIPAGIARANYLKKKSEFEMQNAAAQQRKNDAMTTGYQLDNVGKRRTNDANTNLASALQDTMNVMTGTPQGKVLGNEFNGQGALQTRPQRLAQDRQGLGEDMATINQATNENTSTLMQEALKGLGIADFNQKVQGWDVSGVIKDRATLDATQRRSLSPNYSGTGKVNTLTGDPNPNAPMGGGGQADFTGVVSSPFIKTWLSRTVQDTFGGDKLEIDPVKMQEFQVLQQQMAQQDPRYADIRNFEQWYATDYQQLLERQKNNIDAQNNGGVATDNGMAVGGGDAENGSVFKGLWDFIGDAVNGPGPADAIDVPATGEDTPAAATPQGKTVIRYDRFGRRM